MPDSLLRRGAEHVAAARAIHDEFDGKAMPAEAAYAMQQHLYAASECKAPFNREAAHDESERPERPATAAQLRDEGGGREEVVPVAEQAMAGWQAMADRLVKEAEKRSRQGKSLLASEVRDLAKAREQAYALSELIDDYAPIQKLGPFERFPRNAY
jgi:hypothetical protein